MKIQDLRDDLAEMRYFKKSHLRKKSQQEAGKAATKMAGGASQPFAPDLGIRGAPGTRPMTVPTPISPELQQDIYDYFKQLFGGGQPPVSASNSEPFMVDPGGGSDDWSMPDGFDPDSGNGFGDLPPDITPEELERMLPNWIRQLNAGQIYFGPDGILRNTEGRPVLDQDGNVVNREDLEMIPVDGSGFPSWIIPALLMFLKKAGRRGGLPIPGDPGFPDTDRFFDPGGPLDPNRFRTQ